MGLPVTDIVTSVCYYLYVRGVITHGREKVIDFFPIMGTYHRFALVSAPGGAPISVPPLFSHPLDRLAGPGPQPGPVPAARRETSREEGGETVDAERYEDVVDDVPGAGCCQPGCLPAQPGRMGAGRGPAHH